MTGKQEAYDRDGSGASLHRCGSGVPGFGLYDPDSMAAPGCCSKGFQIRTGLGLLRQRLGIGRGFPFFGHFPDPLGPRDHVELGFLPVGQRRGSI